jgi:hypothetical protein
MAIGNAPAALLVAFAVACGLAAATHAQPSRGAQPVATAATATAPRLVFDAPPPYAAAARRLSATDPERLRALVNLVGLEDAGAPIHVVLAPENHPLARRADAGIGGYALPDRSLAVLLPARVPRYPYDSLEVLLLHEVTHVLAARAAGGKDLPRWFDEGLALLASHGWSLADRSRVVLGAVSGIPGDTRALEAAFVGDAREIATAYALSGALVHHLVRRHGAELVPVTLAGVAGGKDFDAAFETAAGTSLAQAEAGFWRRYRLWYRWLPFATSGAVLWGAVTALAVLAGVRRRLRDAEIRRRWLEEEAAAGTAIAIASRFDEDVAPEPAETIH